MRPFLTLLFLSLLQTAPLGAQEVPAPRSGYAMAYDRAHSRLVVFGGSDAEYDALGDTWVWADGAWARLATETEPPPRTDAVMAYDSVREEVVLFGGRGADREILGDTWRLSGETWARADGPGPRPRQMAAMAFDAGRGRLVLFGGQGPGRTLLGDTWEWDGTDWLQRGSEHHPPPRATHGLAYDAARRRTVLVGGYDTGALNDTWVWDGDDWTYVATASLPPRLHAATAYDANREWVVLAGGFGAEGRERTVYAWNGTAWFLLDAEAPDARAEHEAAYVPGQGVVVFGGVTGQGMDYDERIKTADLWRFDGATWHLLHGPRPSPLPPPTGPHAVGTRVVEWTDDAREERWTEARDRRRLQVQLWYPADSSSAPVPVPYVPSLEPLRASLAAYWEGEPEPLRFDVPGASWEAPVAEGQFPLLVLSHGMNSARFSLTGLATDLASQGYIVAAVDHTYWGPGVAFADGTVVPYEAGMIARDTLSFDAIDGYLAEGIRVMSDDQSFVARRVLAHEEVAAHIDEGRVGALGHSMGGMAADLACLRDPLFAACLSLDGTLGAPVHVGLEPACSRAPFLLVASEQFSRALTDESTRVPQRLGTAWCDPLVFVLDGSRHGDFSDLPLLGGTTPGEIGAAEAARVTRLLVARFFEQAFADAPIDLTDVTGLRRNSYR